MDSAVVFLIAVLLLGLVWACSRLLRYAEKRGWIRPREHGAGGVGGLVSP